MAESDDDNVRTRHARIRIPGRGDAQGQRLTFPAWSETHRCAVSSGNGTLFSGEEVSRAEVHADACHTVRLYRSHPRARRWYAGLARTQTTNFRIGSGYVFGRGPGAAHRLQPQATRPDREDVLQRLP